MTSESSLWNYLRGLQTPSLRFGRVENSAEAGWPDVNYVVCGNIGGSIPGVSTDTLQGVEIAFMNGTHYVDVTPVETIEFENGSHEEMKEGLVLRDMGPKARVTEGWIELKEKDAWPKRPGTGVKVGLRPEQKPWLYERYRLTGKAFILLQIEREYLLMPGSCALVCETWTREKWNSEAVATWLNGIDIDELIGVLV